MNISLKQTNKLFQNWAKDNGHTISYHSGPLKQEKDKNGWSPFDYDYKLPDNNDIPKIKGGLRKIEDFGGWVNKLNCQSPEHNSPMVYEPGKYEYICPKCGKVSYFTVPG